MIRLIYGPKGTGKTQQIVNDANNATKNAKGNIVFVTDKKFDTVRLDFNVKVIYTEDYQLNCASCFSGFLKGLIAGNSDIEYLFIDGLVRIVGNDDKALEKVFETIKTLEKEYNLTAEISVSRTKETLPEVMKELA